MGNGCGHPDDACRSRWSYVGDKIQDASGFCGRCGMNFVLHRKTSKLLPVDSVLIAEQAVEYAKWELDEAKNKLKKARKS